MHKVLCTYVQLVDETADCLALACPEAELVEIDCNNPFQYWAELAARWDGEHDLIIIEPDMVFTPEQYNELRDCPEPWCVFGYAIGDNRTNFSLGFTKFRPEVRSLLADKKLPACDGCQGGWWHLDVHIADYFGAHGYRPHDHGDVGHLHKYDKSTLIKTFDHSVEWVSREQMQRDITQMMKERGWKGPAAYNSHNHTANCDCAWLE